MLPTTRQWPVTWLALARLGAVTGPINYNYTPRELAWMLDDSEASHLVIPRDYVAVFESIEGGAPLARGNVVVTGGATGYPHHLERIMGAGHLGRMKEMVRRSSENVSAVEVEGVLRGVDGVLEAAVVPVPDELRGEDVKAYLKLDPGAAPDDALLSRVFEHCAKNLARFKIPRYVEFVEEFARTPSLKIMKSALLSAKEDLRFGSFDREDGRSWQRSITTTRTSSAASTRPTESIPRLGARTDNNDPATRWSACVAPLQAIRSHQSM